MHVELSGDGLRTGVQFPPAPPISCPRTQSNQRLVRFKRSPLFGGDRGSPASAAGTSAGTETIRFIGSRVPAAARHLISGDAAIRAVRAGDPRARLTDGDGPYLKLFVKGGSRGWRIDCSFAGKRDTLSLGTWPDIGLAAARRKAAEARARERGRRRISTMAAFEMSRRGSRASSRPEPQAITSCRAAQVGWAPVGQVMRAKPRAGAEGCQQSRSTPAAVARNALDRRRGAGAMP